MDADGTRHKARIDKEIEEQAAEIRHRSSVLARLDEQGETRAAVWARHVDKYAITPYDGLPPSMNENDPAHTTKLWQNAASIGSHIAEVTERYRLNNPGNALLEGPGPVRGNKKGEK